MKTMQSDYTSDRVRAREHHLDRIAGGLATVRAESIMLLLTLTPNGVPPEVKTLDETLALAQAALANVNALVKD